MTKQREKSAGKKRGAAQPAANARSDLMAMALAEAGEGRLPQAEAILRQILGRDPANADARYQLGLTVKRQKRWDEAILAFQDVIGRQPKHAEAHYQKGLALAEMRRLAEAEFALRDALESRPWYPAAYYSLGRIQETLGQADAAVESLRSAVKQDARHVDAHFHLGLVEQRRGRLDEAMAAYQRTIELSPAHVDAHNNRGLIYKAQGRLDEAAAEFRKALDLRPNYYLALYNLGNVLWDLDKLDQAAETLRACIAANPGYASAYVSLSNIRRKQGNLQEAEDYARRAIDLDADLAGGQVAMGYVHHERRDFERAAAFFERAVQLDPKNAVMIYDAANAHRESGRLEQAVALYRRALVLEPRYAAAFNNLGLALQELGDEEGAVRAFRGAVEAAPKLGAAYGNLAQLIKYRQVDDNVRAMEALLREPDLPGEQRAALLFGLAKAFDDLKDYARSFEYLHEANRLKHDLLKINLQPDFDANARMIQQLDSAFFDIDDSRGDPSDLPILVVGMARSGTTLIEQILASHSRVHGAGELIHLQRMFTGWMQRLLNGTFPGRASEIPIQELRSLAARYLSALRSHSAAALHVTDKMPFNFRFVGFLRLILPNARVIHCMRDPVDICISCYKRLFYNGVFYAYDLRELGLYYNSYRGLMEHWRSVLPGRMFEIQYEDLVADQEGKTRALLEHCGLPWEDACLRFHETERAIRTASHAQVRQPIYKTSVASSRKYYPYIRPLLETLGIDPEASPRAQ